jgi:hypothetical protein
MLTQISDESDSGLETDESMYDYDEMAQNGQPKVVTEQQRDLDIPLARKVKYLDNVASFRYLIPCVKNYILGRAKCERYNPNAKIKVEDPISSLDFILVFKGKLLFKLVEISSKRSDPRIFTLGYL